MFVCVSVCAALLALSAPASAWPFGPKNNNTLNVDYSWKYLDYTYPSAEARAKDIAAGNYNYSVNVPLDGDVWVKGSQRKVFVTIPRSLGGSDITGIPVTLATVSDQPDPHSPGAFLLAPYPDWSWHRNVSGNYSLCPTVMSAVYRVAIDALDRLWVLDSAGVGVCSPKLLVFDLNTDTLIAQHDLENVSTSDSYLLTPVVDLREDGTTFVYNTDASGAIIVYDHQTNSSWRVEHSSLEASSDAEDFSVAGTNFTVPDGAFGMALGPLETYCNGSSCVEDKEVYYHALATYYESHVKASILRNPLNFYNGTNKASSQFETYSYKRPSQSGAEAMTDSGVLFSGLLTQLSVTCWNSKTAFPGADGELQTVAQNAETLQFTSGMKVRYGRLYAFSSRFQLYATSSYNFDEVNFRLLSGNVEHLIRGTQCEV